MDFCFPCFVLWATQSRTIAIFGGACCGIAGVSALLFFGLSGGLALAAFGAIGIFWCAWRFKLLGAFLSQLLWVILWCAYGFYYYIVVYPPINPNPTNDTQCGVILVAFLIFEAYFLLCTLIYCLFRALLKKIQKSKNA